MPADLRARPPGDHLFIWWLGQSGFAIRYGDELAVLDPYLSESLTQKYAGTGNPHVQMRSHAIEPLQLAESGVTVVSASHQHTDHLDPWTLGPIAARSRELGRPMALLAPEAWRALAAERAGLAPEDVIGIDEGQTRVVGAFSFTAIASAHEDIEHDAAGHCKYLGYVVRCGRWTLYHSGDTLAYAGLADRLRPLDLDIAFLPINGKVGNMSGADAARLARAAGARLVVPCHYDMFEFNTADPRDEFIPACEQAAQSCRVLELGDRYEAA
jgi:L-ascorbate metabolism protein UlaG (beta-lactamase superfamily)